MLDICLGGTGGMMPLPDRFLTCCWAEYQGGAALIDCGEGTQVSLRRAGCRLSRLEALLLTHVHADHVAGLPGLLLSLGNTGREKPLPVYGPKGAARVVKALTVISQEAGFPLEIHEMEGGEKALLPNGLTMTCLALTHRAPCLGYRLTLKRKGIFNPDKARQLGVPIEMYRTLHSGKSVTLMDGRIIEPSMVLDGEREPISLCYMTDSLPVEGMADFARGANLLIGEGMYYDDAMAESMREKTHMLFSDSARVAAGAGVKRLWLTHFSPACTDPENGLERVRAIFPDTHVPRDGEWIHL